MNHQLDRIPPVPAQPWPARLTVEAVAGLLGFPVSAIPVLADRHLLKPLGRPAQNSPKYFSLVAVERLANDPVQLDRATRVVQDVWREKKLPPGRPASTRARPPGSVPRERENS